MRKPRNFDAELKTLDDKTRSLRQRKLEHLAALVMATGADARRSNAAAWKRGGRVTTRGVGW